MYIGYRPYWLISASTVSPPGATHLGKFTHRNKFDEGQHSIPHSPSEPRLQDINAAKHQWAQFAHVLPSHLRHHLAQAAQEPIHPTANLQHEDITATTT